MLEVGKKYKIVYKDNDYTKINSGIVLAEDDYLIHLEEIKEGKKIIGKHSIILINEVRE